MAEFARTVEAIGVTGALTEIPYGYLSGSSPEFALTFMTGGLFLSNLALAFNTNETSGNRRLATAGVSAIAGLSTLTIFGGHPELAYIPLAAGVGFYLANKVGNRRSPSQPPLGTRASIR